VTEPAAGTARDDRRHFLRHRRRVLRAAGMTVGALAALAALLLAPNRLASLRLGELGLAWWAAGTVAVVLLVAVGRGFAIPDRGRSRPGMSRAAPLALAVVWGSPALWLGLPPLLLADGTRGLWPPAVIVGGAAIALVLLGTVTARTGTLVATASALARARWPTARGCGTLLAWTEVVVAGLFVWAQLAAAREIGTLGGWPRAAVIGVTLVILAAVLLPERLRARLAALGGGLALLGLAVPLALIALGTTTTWSFVWSAVASRGRVAFGEGSRFTQEGEAVRGPAAIATMRFADDQRVSFRGGGTVHVEPREGASFARDVEAGEEVVLHPGDRLVVPGGLPLRFEPGRRVPDAPDSGPEWVEPSARRSGWLALLALGVTGLLGALGLPAGIAALRAGRLAPGRGAPLTAALVTLGVVLAVGWSLYAAWLTPEVYVAGVSGAEVYFLPAAVPGLGAWGPVLAWLALGALTAGGAAAALVGLQGLPDAHGSMIGAGGAGSVGRRRLPTLLLVSGAGLLACVVPLGAWVLLLASLGLAASALAPAAVMACWSERASARSVATGAMAGFAVFLGLTLAGIASVAGPAEGWVSAAASAPAALAVPAHLVAAWLLRTRGTPSPRHSLPPVLGGPSAPMPAGSRGG
jgi:hypothetical protein